MAPKRPSIQEWFSGRNVLVTGGTGFMGKALIFKLLDSCPEIGNIYMLIREKRGVAMETRFQHLMQLEPFQVIRSKDPKRLAKIVPVKGDTMSDGLGISAMDKERVLQAVSVVFHMAANVKFDISLKEAVRTNTLGTRNTLAFAAQMPKLDSFIHVSTTYCQCNETVLEERGYSLRVDPDDVIRTVNSMPEDALDAMTSKIMDGQPNTYAFSKALSEVLVQRANLPLGVARPSIVVASFKEPVPGWVDNVNGPTGLSIGAGKGVIRSILCDYDFNSHVIPCDFAVNAIIAFAWKIGLEKPTEPIFMNITQNEENVISWGDAIEFGKKAIMEYPFSVGLWYPGGSVTTSKVKHWCRVVFCQYLPAYVLDAVLYSIGRKPFLIRVQNKIKDGLKLLDYYTQKDWVFESQRIKELEAEMSPADRDTFQMDTKVICWEDYMVTYIQGCRRYCLKEDPSTLPRARKLMFYLYCLDLFVKACFFALIAWLIYTLMMSYSTSTMAMIEDNI